MRTGAQSAGMALPIGALAIRRSASTLMRRRDTNGGPRVGTASDDDITTPLTVAHDAAASVTTDVEAASDVSGDVGHGTGVGDDGSASAPGSRAAGGEESQSSSPAGDSWLNERVRSVLVARVLCCSCHVSVGCAACGHRPLQWATCARL